MMSENLDPGDSNHWRASETVGPGAAIRSRDVIFLAVYAERRTGARDLPAAVLSCIATARRWLYSLHRRAVGVLFLLLTAQAQIPHGYTGGPATKGSMISVTDPAHNGGDTQVCTGATHDDRGAFQATLDYASANGVAIVTMPAATCFMNSYVWDGLLTVNLQMPNGVTLQGTPGASKILETAAGRPVCSTLCTVAVVNIGTFVVSWPRMGCPAQAGPCTGYFALNPTTSNGKTITLANPSQGAQFQVGNYIAVYDHLPRYEDDVINGFQSKVTNVNAGTLTVADAMPRSFAAPYIGNLSTGPARIGHDVDIQGVIVEGACALVMTETFNLTLRDSQFITDTSVYDSSHQYIAVGQWNSLVHYTFDSNQFISTGPNGNWWAAEWPQRNSGFGKWINNTVGVAGAAGFNSWGGSEFSHDIMLTGNHIYTNPSGAEACGFNLGGENVLISNNDFHTSGRWSAPGGGFLCDVLAPQADYPAYQNITYYGNTITCNAEVCVALQALQGLTFNGNTITVPPGSSSVYAILLQYHPANAHLDHNQINIQGGYGIYVIPPYDNSWTINGNTVTAVNGVTGITVGPGNPGGPCSVQNNTNNGFGTDISGDPNAHNCTVGNNQ